MSLEALGTAGGNEAPGSSAIVFPSLTLAQLLNNSTLLPSFHLFCLSQGINSYLDFWLKAREVNQILDSMRELQTSSSSSSSQTTSTTSSTTSSVSQSIEEEEEKMVRGLYTRFLAPGAPEEIELDPSIERELDLLFRRPLLPSSPSSSSPTTSTSTSSTSTSTSSSTKRPTREGLTKALSFAADVLELKGMKIFLQGLTYRTFLKREKSMWSTRDSLIVFDPRDIDVQLRRMRETERIEEELVVDLRSKVESLRCLSSTIKMTSDRFASFLFALESSFDLKFGSSEDGSKALDCLISEIVGGLTKGLRKTALLLRSFESLELSLIDVINSLLLSPLDSFDVEKRPRLSVLR